MRISLKSSIKIMATKKNGNRGRNNGYKEKKVFLFRLKRYVWVLLFFSLRAFLFASRSFLVKGLSFFGIWSYSKCYSMLITALIAFAKNTGTERAMNMFVISLSLSVYVKAVERKKEGNSVENCGGKVLSFLLLLLLFLPISLLLHTLTHRKSLCL